MNKEQSLKNLYDNRSRGGMYLKQMLGICNMNLISLHDGSLICLTVLD